MRQAGRETLELWREAGEWWANEEPKEFETFIDEKGIRRVEMRILPKLQLMKDELAPTEDYSEEIALQKAARRTRGWGEYSRPDSYESYKAKESRKG
jgi:hypothetical protein